MLRYRLLLSVTLLLFAFALHGNSVSETSGTGATGQLIRSDEPLVSSATSTPACVAGLNLVPSPNPNAMYTRLNAVDAVSPTDIWAVGEDYNNVYSDTTYTLATHWDGTRWSIIPSPNVGVGQNRFYGVAAISHNDVWAVGNAHGVNGEETLTEHWDGIRWSIVPSPNVGTYYQYLDAVTAISSNDIWAVGTYYMGNGMTALTLTEHWDGSQWSIVSSPNPGPQDDILYGISATSSSDVWAVGSYFDSSSIIHTISEHWDGNSWSVVPSDNLPGTLYSVVAIAPNDVWAMDDPFNNHGGVYHPTTGHWNGTSWINVDTGFNVAGVLVSASARASNDVWAVGSQYPSSYSEAALAGHWDGSQWAIVSSDDGGATGSALSGVTELAANDVWAVGVRSTPGGGGGSEMLIVHYDGQCATPVPTATPAVTPTDCPNSFVDIQGNVFYTAIHDLACTGVVNGTDATHYTPAGTSTRGQFAKVVVLGFGLPSYTPSGGPTFSDVPPSYFAYSYIESGFYAGILSGFDQSSCQAAGQAYPCYLPNRPITRGQLTKLVVNAAHYPLYTPSGGQTFSDVPPQSVFFAAIETAHYMGVINGYPDNSFRPNNNIRRDEMAQIVYKAVTTP